MTSKQTQSRFLTIGFTEHHNATLLNQITQVGTELGNFYYIDTRKPDYPEYIKECLSNSLAMTFQSEGLVAELSSNIAEMKKKLNF